MPLARRFVALVAALAAALAVQPPVAAVAAPGVSRIAGTDRFATAAAISRAHFPPGVPAAYLVTGMAFPDALAAGPAAARAGGPVLLATRTALPAATAEELARLRPARIVVVGGEGAVTRALDEDLRGYAPEVQRVGGADRYATAAAVSAAAFPTASTVYIASGQTFPDALTATASAHRAESPLLLTARSGLPPATAREVRRLGARRVVILGGSASVDAAVEAQVRALVPEVSRTSGADRTATSAAVSAATFPAGVPVAYLATGGAYADALAGGPLAAATGGPVLLTNRDCVPASVQAELARLAPDRIVLLGGTGVLGEGVGQRRPCASGAAPRTPVLHPAGGPAFPDDGPDPHLARFGDRWYLYTTGTTWGNNLGVLISDRPDRGWRTTTGTTWGSTALPTVPSWQTPGTQWAPAVYERGGRFIMFYAAQVRATGMWCLSVASADRPTGPFTDRSSGPLVCQRDLDGSIDPHPFVDAQGRPWLHWKNNDGFSNGARAVSRVWAAPLAADGMSLAGAPQEVLRKDTTRHPWQTTVDNPQMALVDGVHHLFHTGGDYEGNASYTTGYAVCAGPTGPCSTATQPLLSSYDRVAGPGGGTVAQAADGSWWHAYHAWEAGCTSYACGGERRPYVAPMSFR